MRGAGRIKGGFGGPGGGVWGCQDGLGGSQGGPGGKLGVPGGARGCQDGLESPGGRLRVPGWVGGAGGVPSVPHLRRKCRPGEREEERDRDRDPALEEELFSFMKTFRLPNLVGKPLPRARPAPVPPPRWFGGPRAPPPAPAPRWGGGCGSPEPVAGRGGCRADTSHRFFLGLSATPSRLSLQGEGGVSSPFCVRPQFWGPGGGSGSPWQRLAAPVDGVGRAVLQPGLQHLFQQLLRPVLVLLRLAGGEAALHVFLHVLRPVLRLPPGGDAGGIRGCWGRGGVLGRGQQGAEGVLGASGGCWEGMGRG